MPDLDPDRARPGGLGAVAVIGDGRVGRAVAAALRGADVEVTGPLGRGATAGEADIVLLAVPDAEIAAAAALVAPGRLVGHFSGATTLEHEALGIHPLMTVAGETSFAGVPAAVAGSTPHALERARAIAEAIGMTAFEIADADRAAYHAAASIASNFLVTLEVFAGELAATAGVPRDALVPLAQAALDNWRSHGAAALTGPIARGDEGTVSRQREAVHDRLPARSELFDALTAATRDLAARELRGATS